LNYRRSIVEDNARRGWVGKRFGKKGAANLGVDPGRG
jgi:hypothetical protein